MLTENDRNFSPYSQHCQNLITQVGFSVLELLGGKRVGNTFSKLFVLGSLLYATGPVNIDHVSTKNS